MATSLAARSGAAGHPGRTLLLALALALAACGGGGDASSDATAEAAPALGTMARDSGCTPPPAVDTTLFAGSWAALQASLAAQNVSFADSNTTGTVARVPLCGRGCGSPRMRIVSEARTYCMTKQDLQGQTRITGAYVVLDSAQAFGHTFVPGDSILLFARDTLASATLAYDDSGSVARAPASAWEFRFCSDGHANNRPVGKWRNRATGQFLELDPATVDMEEDETGTYGWMACASGCCQFYIPPPTLPDAAVEKSKGKLPESLPPGLAARPVCRRT